VGRFGRGLPVGRLLAGGGSGPRAVVALGAAGGEGRGGERGDAGADTHDMRRIRPAFVILYD
jgi:hypothetical protein